VLPSFLSFVEAWLLELGYSESAAAVNHFATHGTFAAAPVAPPPRGVSGELARVWRRQRHPLDERTRVPRRVAPAALMQF